MLVNNAGATNRFSAEGNDTDLDAVCAVNAKCPLLLTRACLPHLRAAGHGRIVNVASLSGKRVANDDAAYAMTKFALMAVTHATRRAGWEDGVRATALRPSFVATHMTADVAGFPRDEMIDPDDLAELVATVVSLPDTAAVAELLVNCRREAML